MHANCGLGGVGRWWSRGLLKNHYAHSAFPHPFSYFAILRPTPVSISGEPTNAIDAAIRQRDGAWSGWAVGWKWCLNWTLWCWLVLRHNAKPNWIRFVMPALLAHWFGGRRRYLRRLCCSLFFAATDSSAAWLELIVSYLTVWYRLSLWVVGIVCRRISIGII